MSTVLYITANPNPVSHSYSLSVGEAFVKSYQESHPNDVVTHIDLYKETIPQIDAHVFSGWGKLASGQGFETLSEEEAQKVARLNELVDQFVAADKYVFATPMWNFSYPPVMKAYLDSVSVAGKTFAYTAQGPVGLLKNKKAVHIQASGGTYSEGPAAVVENGHRHIRNLLGLLGVENVDAIFVEGVNQFPERAAEIKAAAIQKAVEKATTF